MATTRNADVSVCPWWRLWAVEVYIMPRGGPYSYIIIGLYLLASSPIPGCLVTLCRNVGIEFLTSHRVKYLRCRAIPLLSLWVFVSCYRVTFTFTSYFALAGSLWWSVLNVTDKRKMPSHIGPFFERPFWQRMRSRWIVVSLLGMDGANLCVLFVGASFINSGLKVR